MRIKKMSRTEESFQQSQTDSPHKQASASAEAESLTSKQRLRYLASLPQKPDQQIRHHYNQQ
jgi:hypothetical protein